MRRKLAMVMAAAMVLTSLPSNAYTSYAKEPAPIEVQSDAATETDAAAVMTEETTQAVTQEDTVEAVTDAATSEDTESEAYVLEETETEVSVDDTKFADLIDISGYSVEVNTTWTDSILDNGADFDKYVKIKDGDNQSVSSDNFTIAYGTYDSETAAFVYSTTAPTTEGDYKLRITGKEEKGYTGQIEKGMTMLDATDLGHYTVENMDTLYIGDELSATVTREVAGETVSLTQGTDFKFVYATKEDYSAWVTADFSDLKTTDVMPTEAGNYVYIAVGIGSSYKGQSDAMYFALKNSNSLSEYNLTKKTYYIWSDVLEEDPFQCFSVYRYVEDEKVELTEEDCTFVYSETYYGEYSETLPESYDSDIYVKAKAKEGGNYIGETSWLDVRIRDVQNIEDYSGEIIGSTTIVEGETVSYKLTRSINGESKELDASHYTTLGYVSQTDYNSGYEVIDDIIKEAPSESGSYYLVAEGKSPYYGKNLISFTYKTKNDLGRYTLKSKIGTRTFWSDQEISVDDYEVGIYEYDYDIYEYVVVETLNKDNYELRYATNRYASEEAWTTGLPAAPGNYYIKAFGINGYIGNTSDIYIIIKDEKDIREYFSDYDSKVVTGKKPEISLYRTVDGETQTLDTSAYDMYFVDKESYEGAGGNLESLELSENVPNTAGEYVCVLKGHEPYTGSKTIDMTYADANDLSWYSIVPTGDRIWLSDAPGLSDYISVKDGEETLSKDVYTLEYGEDKDGEETAWSTALPSKAGSWYVRAVPKGTDFVGTTQAYSFYIYDSYDLNNYSASSNMSYVVQGDSFSGYLYYYDINDKYQILDASAYEEYYLTAEDYTTNGNTVAEEKLTKEMPATAGDYYWVAKGKDPYSGYAMRSFSVISNTDLRLYSLSYPYTVWSDKLDSLESKISVKRFDEDEETVLDAVPSSAYELRYSDSFYANDEEWKTEMPTTSGDYYVRAFAVGEDYVGRTNYRYFYYKDVKNVGDYSFSCSSKVLAGEDPIIRLYREVDETEEVLPETAYKIYYVDQDAYLDNGYSIDGLAKTEQTPTEPGKYVCVAEGNSDRGYTGINTSYITILSANDLNWYSIDTRKSTWWTDEDLSELPETIAICKYDNDGNIKERLSQDAYTLEYCNRYADVPSWTEEIPTQPGYYRVRATGKNPYTGQIEDYYAFRIYDAKKLNDNYILSITDSQSLLTGKEPEVTIYRNIYAYSEEDDEYTSKSETVNSDYYTIGYATKEAYIANGESVENLETSVNVPETAGEYVLVVTGANGYTGTMYELVDFFASNSLKRSDIKCNWYSSFLLKDVDKIGEYITVKLDDAIVPASEYKLQFALYSYGSSLVWSDTLPTVAGAYYVKAVATGENYIDETPNRYIDIKDSYDLSYYSPSLSSYTVVTGQTVTGHLRYRNYEDEYVELDSNAYKVYYLKAEDYDEETDSFDKEKLTETMPVAQGSYYWVAVGQEPYYGRGLCSFDVLSENNLKLYSVSVNGSIWSDDVSSLEQKISVYRYVDDEKDILPKTYYTLEYFVYDEDDNVQILEAAPTSPGSYYVRAKGINGYTGQTNASSLRIYDAYNIENYDSSLKSQYVEGIPYSFRLYFDRENATMELPDTAYTTAYVSYDAYVSNDYRFDNLPMTSGLPTEAGSYLVCINGKEPYCGTISQEVTIYAANDLGLYSLNISKDSYWDDQSKEDLKKEITVRRYRRSLGEYVTVARSSYTLQYRKSDNDTWTTEYPTEPGRYYVKAVAKAPYIGETGSEYFWIRDSKNIGNYSFAYEKLNNLLPGEQLEFTLSHNGETLSKEYYSVEYATQQAYEDNYESLEGLETTSTMPTTVGDYVVIVKGLEPYKGSRVDAFNIKAENDMGRCYVAVFDEYWMCEVEKIPASIAAYLGTDKLADDEYELQYKSEAGEWTTTAPSTVGTYYVKAVAKKNYINETSAESFIIKDDYDLRNYSVVSVGGSPIEEGESYNAYLRRYLNGEGYKNLSTEAYDVCYMNYDAYMENGYCIDDTKLFATMPQTAGTYLWVAKPKGSYKNYAYTTFTIKAKETRISLSSISSNNVSVWSDDENAEKYICVWDNEDNSVSAENYELHYYWYDDNDQKHTLTTRPDEPGYYYVYAKGIGSYSGETDTCGIRIYDVHEIKGYSLSLPDYGVEGKEATCKVYRNKYAEYTELESDNYTIGFVSEEAYRNNGSSVENLFINEGMPINIGKYVIVVQGQGEYSGVLTGSLEVVNNNNLIHYYINMKDVYQVGDTSFAVSVRESETDEVLAAEHYTVSYTKGRNVNEDNASAYKWSTQCPAQSGNYTVRVQGEAPYEGTLYKSFELMDLQNAQTFTGSSVNLVITGEYTYVKYVPEQTDTYVIGSESNIDTYGVLRNADGDSLYSDDDSGNNSNFMITHELEAGNTYYVGVRKYNQDTAKETIVLKITASSQISPDPEACVHNVVEDPAVAATCTTAGKTKGSHCSKCGTVITRQTTLPALGHNPVAVADTPSSCQTAGCTGKTVCSRCQVVTNAGQSLPLAAHNFGAYAITKEATAVTEGVMTRTCTVCGTPQTAPIAKLKATIKVNATSITLKVKQSTKAVKVSGLAKGDKVKSWKSSNTKIVKVTNTGKITAQNKTGSAKITITLASGLTKKITVKVQKKEVACTKVKLSAKTLKLSKGKSKKLTVTVAPITCVQKATFKTSNKKVATVDSKGKIVAKGKGSATITVTVGKKKATCKVTVK